MKLDSAYEILSVSFRDIPLSDQIRYGINDWRADDLEGRDFYGRTQSEAEQNRAEYLAKLSEVK
jgi:hypothetical protein